MSNMTFQKAVRRRARLRLAIAGPSGSGKTTGALMIAKGLGGRIAVVDTERGSASLYSHLFEYDTLELQPPYTPERFIEAIKAAEDAGYDTCVIDSITHEWNGAGGVLEIVDMLAKASRSGSSYNAWNEGSSRHRKFVDAMLQSSMHIIATLRTKAAYVQEKNERTGKTEIKKVGMAPEQRDGIEYEFTVVLDVAVDGHVATSSKDRTGLFVDPFIIAQSTGEKLKAWLDSGADPLPVDPLRKPELGEEEHRRKRDAYVRRLKQIIRSDETEEAISASLVKAHDTLAEDIEMYNAVWACLDATERAGISDYIKKAKGEDVMLPNGRAGTAEAA